MGVVDDVHDGPLDAEVWPTAYYPTAQSVDNSFCVIVRTTGDEKASLPELVAAVHGIDPGLGTGDVLTMQQRIHDSQSANLHRGAAWLVSAFAAVALLLSAVGLYGVVAYSVSQRTREIGVRIALGAQRRTVYALILKECAWLSVVGVTLGLLLALAATRLLRDLLFGVKSWDIPTLTAVIVLMTLCAMLASFLPARRAASVNPTEALRSE